MKNNNLPEYLPEYKIEKSDEKSFSLKWEELMGWHLIPKLNEKISWGIYDLPSRKCDYLYDMKVIGRATVHGIEGVEITAEEYQFSKPDEKSVRGFVAQLTDTHCRYLATSYMADGIKHYVTFLDGEEFVENWGYGEDNCGHETQLSPKGLIKKEDDKVTCQNQNPVMDIVGRYEVTIGGKKYDTVCVVDLGSYNQNVLSEHYLDKNGRTILWRRFNKNDWHLDRYKKLWTEQLPENERLSVNGETYVHWYDCITDFILR